LPDPTAWTWEAVGYIGCIWAGSGADSNLLLAGSGYGGGVFKSTDAGKHWSNITDNAPVGGIISINNISVSPYDKNKIYLGTAKGGIVRTTNGGITWQQEFIADSTESDVTYATEDSTKLYARSGKKIYCRHITGTTWAYHRKKERIFCNQ
jgi:photosystem II stability/assembly factor-like uncharacterized protein